MRAPLIIALLLLSTTFSIAQSLTPMRSWTHQNGKKIQAEMLKFTHEFDEKQIIRLRIPGGSTYPIKPQSLSAEDQALILKKWFDIRFRDTFDKDLKAHFFYSTKVPSTQADSQSIAYLGCDAKDSWIRLRIGVPKQRSQDGTHIVMVNDRNEMVRMKYNETNVEWTRKASIIDIAATKHKEQLQRIWSNNSKTKLYLENESGNYSEINLSSQEKAAFKEVIRAFNILSTTTEKGIWWNRFKNITPSAPTQEPAPETPADATVPKSETLIKSQLWTLEKTGENFEASVSAFNQHQIEFRIASKDPEIEATKRLVATEDLNPEGRQQIAKFRMDYSLYPTWHPYNEKYTWFWPLNWPKANQRIEKNALLFAIERTSGKPQIFYQVNHPNTEGLGIESCRIKASKVSVDLEFETRNSEPVKLRNQDNTVHWYRLNSEETALLMIASPGLEELEYEITAENQTPQTGKLTTEEYQASIEAIEVYRAWNSLIRESASQ